MKAKTRSVIRLGTTLAVTLPAEFVREHQIRAGDKVAVLSDHWLQVVPFRRVTGKEVKGEGGK